MGKKTGFFSLTHRAFLVAPWKLTLLATVYSKIIFKSQQFTNVDFSDYIFVHCTMHRKCTYIPEEAATMSTKKTTNDVRFSGKNVNCPIMMINDSRQYVYSTVITINIYHSLHVESTYCTKCEETSVNQNFKIILEESKQKCHLCGKSPKRVLYNKETHFGQQ
jgi:hypothetical protein